MEINRETADFIEQHANDDVRQLALMGRRFPHLDMPFVLDQVAGRQMARQKLPTWAATPGIVYPPHLSMEQCSSEETARYKVMLATRLIAESKQENRGGTSTTFVDLTGGFGVDFSFMGKDFDACTYVEQQERLCQIAQNNFPRLGLKHAHVVHADGIEFLHAMERVDMIYLDPARRDEKGGKTVLINDCTPNILSIQELLMSKARYVIIKLSPMLHWQQAVDEINKNGGYVREVHIVAVKNECKELLLVLGEKKDGQPIGIYCVNNSDVFAYDMSEANIPQRPVQESIAPGMFLYEPNVALMKAGCFAQITHRWQVDTIAHNSHLFVSADEIADFSGRQFKILAISSFNRKELKQHLQGIAQANITTRNFPMSVEELRKKLKIKEGGQTYLFATTTQNNEKVLLVCERM